MSFGIQFSAVTHYFQNKELQHMNFTVRFYSDQLSKEPNSRAIAMKNGQQKVFSFMEIFNQTTRDIFCLKSLWRILH